MFKVIYIDNILTTLQSNDIRDHAGVFIVNFKRIVSLIFSLADYLVSSDAKRLDSPIFRRSHNHWLQFFSVELTTALKKTY